MASSRKGLKIALGVILGVLVFVVILGVAGGILQGMSSPKYRVVSDDGANIVVEVDSASDLQQVFDDVKSKHTKDGGYFVVINCSKGGAAKADNRLANGKFAIGSVGAAKTGLSAGESKFEPVAGASCA